jgi:hypothetical protein
MDETPTGVLHTYPCGVGNRDTHIMTTFKQTRKVGVAGSFQNQMMGNNSSVPVIGKGATILMYSDRHAYQVTWVSDCGTRCHIAPAIMKYVGTGYGDEQYEYQGYKEYHEEIVWRDKKGWCRVINDIKYEPSFERTLDAKYNGRHWFGFHADDTAKEMGVDNLFNPDTCRLNLVQGFTKPIKRYSSVSILFGVIDEYRDPSF